MSIQAFLYRRLAKFVTCELALAAGGSLRLRSKYDVASVADVFCQPFYWQVYSMLDRCPKTVVDCGGHLGHFCILVEQCIVARFGHSEACYTIVEPNPTLLAALGRNLAESRLKDRARVVQGLLGGQEEGTGDLWVEGSNLLNANTLVGVGKTRIQVPYVSLTSVCPSSQIDLLKIDIEGAEYELLPRIPKILERTQRLLIEFHASSEAKRRDTLAIIRLAGLLPVGPTINRAGLQLSAFARP